MAPVSVTLIEPDDRRHTVTVEAESLYAAIFQYNYLANSRSNGLPRPERSSVFEVQPAGGPIRRTTYGAALNWANRITNERAAKKKKGITPK